MVIGVVQGNSTVFNKEEVTEARSLMSYPLILRLDVTGQPVKWIPWQEAVCIYARDMVAWTAGEHAFALHGGTATATPRTCGRFREGKPGT